MLIKLILILYKTAFHIAVEKENIDIIKLLLTNDKIDINISYKIINYSIKLHFDIK